MRVVVDEQQCEGNALCVGVAPDLFELPDDSDVVRLLRPMTPADEAAVRDAVRLCPKQALSLVDE